MVQFRGPGGIRGPLDARRFPPVTEIIMKLSARNQLSGTVKSVKLGAIMAEVVIEVGDQEIVAAISRSSAKRLKLKKGDEAVAIIKSTEVIIGK